MFFQSVHSETLTTFCDLCNGSFETILTSNMWIIVFLETSKKAELRNGRTRLSCREPSTRPSRYVLRKLKMSSDVVHLKGSEMDMRSINCRGEQEENAGSNGSNHAPFVAAM